MEGCLAPTGFGSEGSVIEFIQFLAEHASKSDRMKRQTKMFRALGDVIAPDDAALARQGAVYRRAGACGSASDHECAEMYNALFSSTGAVMGRKAALQVGSAAAKSSGRAGSLGFVQLAEALGLKVESGGAHIRVTTASGDVRRSMPQ